MVHRWFIDGLWGRGAPRPYNLCRNHFLDKLLVIVRLLVTRFCALQQPVIALRVKQTLLVEPCLLKLVVHIGGDDEIILTLQQLEQIFIYRFWGGNVAVEVDMAAPVGPVLFLRREGVEAGGIHVGKAVLADEVGKMPLEPLARIGETCSGRKTGARTYHNGLGGLKGVIEFLDVFHKCFWKILKYRCGFYPSDISAACDTAQSMRPWRCGIRLLPVSVSAYSTRGGTSG